MWKDRNTKKFKMLIHIVHTSIQIGILDLCLSDSYFGGGSQLFSFGRIKKGTQGKLQNSKLIFICSIYTRIKEHTTKPSFSFLMQALLYLVLNTVLFATLHAFLKSLQETKLLCMAE